ncbi:hypothetical protein [Novosphingobium nitrogenifigens]|nr:hypothetical protein [Novosphingobium nitrogenifigens]
MAETTPEQDVPLAEPTALPLADSDESPSRFARAVEDATGFTASAREKVGATATEWGEAAGLVAGQAKDKGLELVRQGQSMTSGAIAVVGRTLGDTAPTIDEKLGVQYGDFARTAAQALQTTAEKIEAKDLTEIGGDVKDFVRQNPMVAVGIAAVAGYALARMVRGSDREA